MEINLAWDGTKKDMERLKAENASLILQNRFDADFLVFSDKARG